MACCYQKGEVLHPSALSDGSSEIHPTFQWDYLTWRKKIIQMCCWLCVPSILTLRENEQMPEMGDSKQQEKQLTCRKGDRSSDPAERK